MLLASCGTTHNLEGNLSFAVDTSSPLSAYNLTGNTQPVRDPSIIQQGSTYYLFSTDIPGEPANNYLPIRCSQDESNWKSCGSIFSQIPSWISASIPGVNLLWAPDISFFNGLYHLYYAGSTLGSQRSVIGLATNTTLDSTDPAYKWVDDGEVIGSVPGDDFNAIDPNILVDTTGKIWLAYGSYWSGIKQIQIQPGTGMPIADSTRYDLATRPGVPNNPIEGASIVSHGGFYYLFVSVDYCCNTAVADDNYKEAVGRSASPNGPFVDADNTPMMDGGGTVLLESSGAWNAPGGGTAYIDPISGQSLIVFHALNVPQNGTPYMWMSPITWVNNWPVLSSPYVASVRGAN